MAPPIPSTTFTASACAWEHEETSAMHTDWLAGPGKRTGFTMVEMLVVLGIILMLSVLTVLFMPRISERQRVAQGADLLQGWLLMAKQRALRDRVPTGIRLQLNKLPTDPYPYVRDL